MQRVSNLRRSLSDIPDALVDIPPGEGPIGGEDAQVLWAGEDSADTLAAEPASQKVTEQDDPFLDAHGFSPVFTFAPANEEGVPRIGNAGLERIAREVLVHGVDALGYYVPFHCRGAQWGIYVKLSGIAYLAGGVFNDLPVSDHVRYQMAFQSILDHELFHFATEYAVGQLEFFLQEPIWAPRKKFLVQGTPPYLELEEELANAYMLGRGKAGPKHLSVRGKLDSLRKFTHQQPAGYCDGFKVRAAQWPTKLAELVEAYAMPVFEDRHMGHLGAQGVYDWQSHFPCRPHVDWRYCPIHLVDDSQRHDLPLGWLKAFSRLERIEETSSFVKELHRLADPVRRAWERIKVQLATAITPGRDFKPWPSGGTGMYSLRVTDGFRAHVRFDQASGAWTAIGIGDHKTMGHG